eukprot:1805112-Prymnesium_polylepis.1
MAKPKAAAHASARAAAAFDAVQQQTTFDWCNAPRWTVLDIHMGNPHVACPAGSIALCTPIECVVCCWTASGAPGRRDFAP